MATVSRQAVAAWTGDVARGEGQVTAGTRAFAVPMTFPRLAGKPHGATTPDIRCAVPITLEVAAT